MKFIVDASTLISISQTCLIKTLENLRQLSCEFVITKSVEYEAVTHPMQIKRFELNAERIKKSIDDGWIEILEPIAETEEIEKKIEFLANNSFFYKQKPIKIIHRGEIETLALLKTRQADALVIDERTARMLIENPEAMRKTIQRRKGLIINKNEKNISELKSMFEDVSILRSTELVAFAFENGLLKDEIGDTKQSLEAALYAVKYAGCAVSGFEIEQFLKGK
ncbi:MAG: hypothetical protein V1672_00075 [Candidatus Diapherotrites archaeon]